MTSAGHVVVVGSCIADTSVHLSKLPSVGETIMGAQVVKALGGKGANQAIGVARLGIPVDIVASLGSDEEGQSFLSQFEKDGVSTSFVSRKKCHTGMGFPLILDSGENAIIVVPSAAMKLTSSEVARAEPRIASAKALLLQFEIPIPAITKAIEIAKLHQVPVFLNPAPILEGRKGLVALADVVIPNQTEAEWLTGISINNEKDAIKAAGQIRERGPSCVIITLGSKGCLLSSKSHTELLPAFKVKSVDPTGAGDAFCAGIVWARSSGYSWPEAAKFANACGAYACEIKGAIPSLPTFRQAKKFFKSHRTYGNG